MADESRDPSQLEERLHLIRTSPKQYTQKHVAVILFAVEETLRDQKAEFTPTAYFAALLALLAQYVQPNAEIISKESATAVTYLLDLVTPHVPVPILRSKFGPVLTSLAPALTHPDADAPFLRASIGCLVSLLVVQDTQAWALPQSQISPRRAVAGLLVLAIDKRPKVRKQAVEGLAKVLQNGPPTPSLDHPVADMCAETALRNFESLATSQSTTKKQGSATQSSEHEPAMIHSMQLVKTIANSSGGWPSRSLDSLCEVLFSIARSRSEYLTMASFDVFEAILEGMANDPTASKLPRLLEAVTELQPSQNDSQLLPPWIAVISRGYDVSAQIEAIETFQRLPPVFDMISGFLASSSFNIRVSAAECLVSLIVNCIPSEVILQPSVYDEKTLEKLASLTMNLLDVKYQSAWMEGFTVVSNMFDALKWHSGKLLSEAVATVGELRASESFAGKKEADEVLSKAISAMGPEAFLEILPLNLAKPIAGQPGRAWLMPLLRDSVCNTNLAHFKKELVPLSELLFQKVINSGIRKTMEIKIFETLVQQIWACLPGYCDRTLDVITAFDQGFAEMLSKLLYQQPEMRLNICRALKSLVASYKTIRDSDGEEDLLAQGRISNMDATKVIEYLATLAPNILAVLFNVYGETNPQQRGYILECIDIYLSITAPNELSETFERVASMLETSAKDEEATERKPNQDGTNPPVSHALMDIVVAISVYLPRERFQSLFNIAARIVSKKHDPQLQKKAYKLIPRLAHSEVGKAAMQDRNAELREMLLINSETVITSAKKDRLTACAEVVKLLPSEELYFIPSILPEAILCTKEINEGAREAAFDLIVAMGEKMQSGGMIDNGKVSHMPNDAGSVAASLEEYLTMLSAGLAGSTPHMISASVTAISRFLYHFHASLSEPAITDLIETMDLFLKSPTREVVRSVLGFVKICVLSLPVLLMQPRLPTLIPHLMSWAHEHKAHFRAKVKNILERMIRRFGIAIVELHCPEADRKQITAIRKARDRKKRAKTIDPDAAPASDDEAPAPRAKFENEFDDAVYGSDSDSASDASEAAAPAKRRKGAQTYIHEDGTEPLDLLSKGALAHISSTRPVKARALPKPHRTKVDVDGKLLLREGDDDDDDAEMMDFDDTGNMSEKSLAGGIDAYVQAIRGRDSAKRGQRGRLKFTNKQERGEEIDEDEERQPGPRYAVIDGRGRGRGGGRGSRNDGGRGNRDGRGRGRGRGGAGFPARRGLGVEKSRGARMGSKSPRGKSGGRR